MNITRRLTIHGRVQGVFYRESMRLRAEELKVTGWVCNRSDGTVEAVVQGEASAVEILVDWARRGPPAAKVDRVEVDTADAEPRYSAFEKRPMV
jgi:acylphosphatase